MEIYSTIAAVIIGGLITLLCSRHYYQKGAKELAGEAEKLRDLNNLVLRGMEHAHLVTLNRDTKGNIIGFKLKLNLSDTISLEDNISPVLARSSVAREGEGK